MHVLVTGGCGFIGSNFTRHLLGAYPDVRVTNLDALTYAGNVVNLTDLEADSRYRFVHADITDVHAVEEAVRGVDAVVHFAAETHVDRSILSSAPFVKTNVSGTQVLLDSVLAAGVGAFVQISTDETYGSCSGAAFTEEAPLVPRNPYSATKAAADMLVHSYWITHGLPSMVVRPSNNYGPYQFPEKLIPLAITNVLDDTPVPLYGDGGNVREWLFVEDTCRAIDLVLHNGTPGETYNVGPGTGTRNSEVLHEILGLMGVGDDMIRVVPDRPGHDRRYAIDTTKIRALGWEHAFDLEAGLAATVAWYASHADWWRPLKSKAEAGRLPTTSQAL